jgi:hypothetical protein
MHSAGMIHGNIVIIVIKFNLEHKSMLSKRYLRPKTMLIFINYVNFKSKSIGYFI